MSKITIGVNGRFIRPKGMEGVGLYSFETVRWMALDHPESQFIIYSDDASTKEVSLPTNCRVVTLFPPARLPILMLWYQWAMARAAKKDRVDAIYSPNNFLSLQASAPTVMVLHDLAYIHHPETIPTGQINYYRRFTPKYIQRAHHIITVSQYVKDDIIQQFAVDESDITVAYNGVRSLFHPLTASEKHHAQQTITDGHPYFIYIGAIQPRKNVMRLIQAFELFKQQYQQEHRLVLVGRKAWGNDTLEKALNRSSVRDQIIQLGHVPNKDLANIIGAADAMIYVSLFEGFGVPLIEAMASGVPVITSDRTSMPEVIGDAGITVDPTSVPAIAAAMNKIVSESTFAARLKYAGEKRITTFDWQVSAEIIYKKLEQAAKSKSPLT